MNRHVISVVAATAIALAANSADARPGKQRCMSAKHKAELATYDADKNGRLDPPEHRAMMEARRAEALTRYDKDGDGELSKTERAALHHDKRVEHFEQLDTNRDAELSAAEVKAACGPIAHDFDRIDADSSGTVSWTEFEKAAKAHHRRHGPPPPPRPRH